MGRTTYIIQYSLMHICKTKCYLMLHTHIYIYIYVPILILYLEEVLLAQYV